MAVYANIARQMLEITNRVELLHSLRSSAAVEFYDIREDGGRVSVLLKDQAFRQPGPRDDLAVTMIIHCDMADIREPLPLDRLRALGALFPLLNGGHTEAAARAELEASLPQEECSWAVQLLDRLLAGSFVQLDTHLRPGPTTDTPTVTLLSHSSLLFKSTKSSVLVDPLRDPSGPISRGFQRVAASRPDAILCSHSHWDHCNLDTLLLFDKRTPIIVPRIENPTAFNPPMVAPLRMLGFTAVHEAAVWEPIAIGDIEVIPTPFHGEQDEPGAEIDHMTYVIRTDGLVIYGGVDCYVDDDKSMDPVLADVRDRYRPDIAFLPISKMVFRYRDGGVNGFCRYVDQDSVQRKFQYTAGPDDAAEWARILDPGVVVPYATFSFARTSSSEPVLQFETQLRARGLQSKLYPPLPMSTIRSADVRRHVIGAARRRCVLMLYRSHPDRVAIVARKGVRRARKAKAALSGILRRSLVSASAPATERRERAHN